MTRVGWARARASRVLARRGLGEGQRPRLEFAEQRPGGSEPRGSLDSPLLSRLQLGLAPEGELLHVENLGRCPLLHNERRVDTTVARPLDTLTLLDTAVFLVELRSSIWPSDEATSAWPAFGFGAADAHGLVGESAAAWQLRAELTRAASSDAHVLIHGPSGVGKELCARALHRLSSRARGQFVSRNAATLPAGLIDAELFGNIKNYPNAGSPERAGLIGEAHGGSLLLDEIGELPVTEQAHLLRALDPGGEYQRLGDAKVRQASLRVIALTNRALGELKPDLSARFPVRIGVPSLAERRGDIPLLMRAIYAELRKGEPGLAERFEAVRTPGAQQSDWEPIAEPRLIELCMRHPFEGNYRELERLLRLALSTSRGRYVEATAPVLEALGVGEGQTDAPVEAPDPLALDRDALAAALTAARGSATLAAKRLGLKNRHVLYRLMKKHKLSSS